MQTTINQDYVDTFNYWTGNVGAQSFMDEARRTMGADVTIEQAVSDLLDPKHYAVGDAPAEDTRDSIAAQIEAVLEYERGRGWWS